MVIAAGARKARRLSVPGSDAVGVVLAVDYLSEATKALLDGRDPQVSAKGLDVVVIGGGDTGTDCVATALRQGAASVTQLEFLPEPPGERRANNAWPEWPHVRKDDYGQVEAAAVFGRDPRQWGVETLEVLGEDGKVCWLRVASLGWSAGKSESVAGIELVITAQLVLLAMGFVGPEGYVFDALGVSRADDGRGLPEVAASTHRAVTSGDVPVFVAGDCRGGSSLVVSAIADGLLCAAEVADLLGI
jgi:glutamate synthase (NADPH/NADH) small chain